MAKRAFRGLLLIYLLLFVLSGVLHIIASKRGIPPDVLQRADNQLIILSDSTPLALELAIVGLYVLTVVLACVGYVGLFAFWKPSRHIFLCSVILKMLFPFSVRWTVANSYISIGNSLELVLDGIILALVYWGPVSRFFTKKESK